MIDDSATALSMGIDAHSNDDAARSLKVVTRELSFSNGIASAAARITEDDSNSDPEPLEDSSFTFGSSDQKQADFDGSLGHGVFDELVVQIHVSDEEFERGFGGLASTPANTYTEKLMLKNGYEMLHVQPEQLLDDKATSNPMLKTVLATLAFVLAWYTFSTCLTLYNKLLLGQKYGRFPAPLLMNTIHFSMQALVSTVILRFFCPSLKPTVPMSWKDYFMRVIPTAVSTALDVDFTNASLVFISVTFATMCKSATPVFLLFFAFLFKLESLSVKLFGIMTVISVGVLLTVAKETEFNLLGFVLVMLAALSSGFRWVVTQLLLQKEEYGLNNPLAAMSYFTPVMALITAVFSLILEPWSTLAETPYFNTTSHTLESCLLMLLGGSLAFFMVMAEYFLISRTSAVTMTVAGVVKEVVTIVVAIMYFGDQFTVLKAIGLLIIMVGVGLFNWLKYKSLVEGKVKLHELEGIEISSQPAVKYSILRDETSLEKV